MKKSFKNNKLGFTLVELIVVITILAIMGTIAYFCLQNYSINARDTVRTSDMKNIQKSLSFYVIKTGKFPEPTNGINVTYSGVTVWTQGVFGDSMLSNVGVINKKPIDPLKSIEYSYSVTPNKQEYQLIGALESLEITKNNFLIEETYAKSTDAKAYSAGTYNGLVTRVNTGGIDYVIALPSITSKNLKQTDLIQILINRSLVYNNYGSLPNNFSGAFDSDNIFNFYPNKIVLFSGALNVLNDPKNQIQLLKEIQDSYKGTIVVTDDIQIKNIVDTSIDLNSPSDKAKVLACSVINFNLRYFVECNDIDYITFYIINVLHLDIKNLPGDKINAVFRAENGDLRFGTNGGVGYYDGTNWSIFNTGNSELISNIVLAIAQDSEGLMWFGTNNGISIYDGNDWTSLTTFNSGLMHNHVLQIYLGSEGKMWIGTNNGVNSYNAGIWMNYTKKKTGMSHDQVNSIFEDNLGNIWFGTKVGLDKFKNGVLTSYGTSQGLPSKRITYIMQDLNNNLWIGTTSGISKYNRTNFTTIDTVNSAGKLPSNKITYIFQNQNNGNMWFGTDNGAVKYVESTNTWTLFNTSNQLSGNVVSSINLANNGSIIIINDGGVDTLINP